MLCKMKKKTVMYTFKYCFSLAYQYSMSIPTTKICRETGCKTRASFNVEGQTRALYCADHKKEGMVNVVSKTCLECRKQPVFNMEGETRALYCSAHKKEGMVDVKNNTCLECKKRPTFNMEGQTRGLYCADHKKEGMVDVKHKTCLECRTRANFNMEGETRALYCSAHKKEGMVDVKNNTCLSEWCRTKASNPQYEGYCMYCFMHLFPGKPVARNYKTKEVAVVDYVKTQFPEFTWVTDRIVQGGCSRRRPDLCLDLGYQVVIVEVDENQHQDYDCSCENKRIMELSRDVGHRPIVFIRFNPDEYEMGHKHVSSCWAVNGTGICAVKKSKQAEWERRLLALKTQIEYWSQHNTDKTIEIVQLFYDV